MNSCGYLYQFVRTATSITKAETQIRSKYTRGLQFSKVPLNCKYFARKWGDYCGLYRTFGNTESISRLICIVIGFDGHAYSVWLYLTHGEPNFLTAQLCSISI